ncbi:uncharacterized protein LOC133840870 [Drosophila sulfurigaster albostrigata]|uniref:uncharacterized protein LOC133840870 n=1 Tax=Drosophila sulfurigaster albostrigata TaxID=89887 RepID=UPI002D21DAA5|nr:uncharacterized protein LOC133840870 [Drosophila sulfurigaster albostrigata]
MAYHICGATVSFLNLLYSLGYFAIVFADLVTGDADRRYLHWPWLVVYAVNMCVNTFMFRRYYRAQRVGIWFWFFISFVVLLLHIYKIQSGKLSSTIRTINEFICFYIFITLIIMLFMMSILKDKTDETIEPTKSRRKSGSGAGSSVDEICDAPAAVVIGPPLSITFQHVSSSPAGHDEDCGNDGGSACDDSDGGYGDCDDGGDCCGE